MIPLSLAMATNDEGTSWLLKTPGQELQKKYQSLHLISSHPLFFWHQSLCPTTERKPLDIQWWFPVPVKCCIFPWDLLEKFKGGAGYFLHGFHYSVFQTTLSTSQNPAFMWCRCYHISAMLFFLGVLKNSVFHLHDFNSILHNKIIFGWEDIMAKFL